VRSICLRAAIGAIVAVALVASVRMAVSTLDVPSAALTLGTAPHRTAALVDLRTTGVGVQILGAFSSCISVVTAPTDTDGDGFREGVLKVTLDPNGIGACRAREACFILDYEGTPSGWTFNLGDSLTNNGFGGDSGTQDVWEAETQIVDEVLSVFGTQTSSTENLTVQRLRLTDSSIKICVKDQFLSWGNPAGILSTPNLQALYGLNGQADPGPGGVNFDLYVGLNRVIFGPGGRIGGGLARVLITLSP
jgi:hypothetical protein